MGNFFPTSLKASFTQQGFIRVPALFSAAEVETIGLEILNYQKEIVPQIKPHLRSEKCILLNNDPTQPLHLGNIDRFSPFFEKLIRDSRFLTLAEFLLGCPVTPWTMHFRNTPPQSPHETFAHQDADGPYIDPCIGVGFWLALGDYGEIDGCLRYVDGSHRDRFQPHMAGPLPNRYYQSQREVVVPAKTGDVLAHDWFTVHRTARNEGSRSRWALMISYVFSEYQRMERDEWLGKYENAPA